MIGFTPYNAADRENLISWYLSIWRSDLEIRHTVTTIRISRSFLWYTMNELMHIMKKPNDACNARTNWCMWCYLYKRKRGIDGKVETFKVRLVAKRYTQKEGIDYEETFSPVAMLKSIRILLSIATHYDYEIWQMDIKTAFLNGNLE